ncbi:MAG: NAD(+)/NADH kinase [Oscillospiraceae bacterium]|jgi:NAD+ kinase|nr:NAD(+)/NADH kinase [Oscillospiraceae bacterium]
MKKVALYPNPERDEGFGATLAVAALCRAAGAAVTLPETCAAGLPETPDITVCPEPEALRGADCIIVLGGDGTVLHAAKAASREDIPILGVNLGRVGFMTELEAGELPLLREVLAGRFSRDRRMMLRVEVRRDGCAAGEALALNDAVLTGGLTGRVIPLEVLSDGQPILSFFGDGVIVATPTGSTAYSMSAGGPIIEPTADSLVVTPLCPHALFAQSIVFSANRRLTLRPRPGNPAFLTVDGSPLPLRPGDAVSIDRAPSHTTLIRVKEHSFYERLNRKLQKPP